MNETMEKSRFGAALACSAFTCAMIMDGSMLLRDLKSEFLWQYELNTIRTAIFLSGCLVMVASAVFGSRFRKEALKRRALLSSVFGACSVLGHVAALVLPGINTSDYTISTLISAATPLLMFAPTSLAAGLAASFAWGSRNLSDALCFPCVMILAVLLGDSLAIANECVSLACAIAGFAILSRESKGGNECFCAWSRPLTYRLPFVLDNANTKGMQPKWGVAAMVSVTGIAAIMQAVDDCWPAAIVTLTLLTFFYRGDLSSKSAGAIVVLISCMLAWPGIPNGRELCVMTALSTLGALACLECGPKGLLLGVGGMLAAVSLGEGIHGPVCYFVLADVSAIVLLLLIPCALFMLACRPELRIVSTWTIAHEEAEEQK